jgi:3'-5' exonuclease
VVGRDRGRERDAGLGAAVHDHPIDVERRLAVLLPLPGRLDVRGRARRLRLQGLIKAPTIAVVTFDPAIVENEPDKQQLIDWDVRLAARLLMTASLEPPVGTYRWVPGFSEITHAINCRWAETGKPVEVSLDIETMGLYPWYKEKQIVSIGFTLQAGKADCLYLGPYPDPVPVIEPELFAQIEWPLTTPRIRLRGSNLKYDLVWIAEKWGIECTNFTFDNCLVGSLLDENRSNGLNLHAKLMTDMGGYDDGFEIRFDKSRMERVPPADLLPYRGADIDASFRVAKVLRRDLLNDPELACFYTTVLHPASRAFEKIERRGLLLQQPLQLLQHQRPIGRPCDDCLEEVGRRQCEA